MNNTPDQILERIQDGISNVNYCPGGHTIDKYELGLANEAFYQLILTELIGGDEDRNLPRNHNWKVEIDARNFFRAEQRQTLAKLFGITEGEK